MGNELVSDSQPHRGGESKGFAALSYTEVFYNHLPYYLAIGMTPEQFWDGDCRLTESYRRADELKQRRRNQDLWLQGMYFYEALCDVSPILQAFAKKVRSLLRTLLSRMPLPKNRSKKRRNGKNALDTKNKGKNGSVGGKDQYTACYSSREGGRRWIIRLTPYKSKLHLRLPMHSVG